MILVRFFIIIPQLSTIEQEPSLSHIQYALLILSTVLIAAAGYIINDYFDTGIDKINKPQKNIFTNSQYRRWGIVAHIVLNTFAIIIGIYLAWHISSFKFILFQVIPIGLLWFYSTHYKKQLLVGNIVVSVLTGLIVVLPGFYEQITHPPYYTWETGVAIFLLKVLSMYFAFAFLCSMIREIIKDMEDARGDAAFQCKTVPLVWGEKSSKIIVSVIAITLFALVSFAIYRIYLTDYMNLVYFALAFVNIPIIYLLIKLWQAKHSKDLHTCANIAKLIMLMGLFTMVFMKDFR